VWAPCPLSILHVDDQRDMCGYATQKMTVDISTTTTGYLAQPVTGMDSVECIRSISGVEDKKERLHGCLDTLVP
jgi:hypothetical protein